ncbi:MAG: SPOR domain-containing protein [Bacteroidetes bacterium]|nr:SPOR domain-containing protein [Bacteroidota bacterium]
MKPVKVLISLLLPAVISCGSTPQGTGPASGGAKVTAAANPLDTLRWNLTRTPFEPRMTPKIIGPNLSDEWLRIQTDTTESAGEETLLGSRGFRIQVFAKPDRALAEQVLMEARLISGLPAYLSYQAPNYIVRIGNFPNEARARASLESLENRYPNGTVVPDFIEK